MSYFDESENVSAYLKMCEELGPSFLVKILPNYVASNSTILELGMGPGHDLEALSNNFRTTGSDTSKWFLDHYTSAHPTAELLKIDALTLETDSTFDAIYSNKVLHQLSIEEISSSFENQAKRLNAKGVAFHSFWKGTGSDEFAGDACYYFEPEQISNAISTKFEILEFQLYEEMSPDDSFWIAARKK
jgi:hypothetical protein